MTFKEVDFLREFFWHQLSASAHPVRTPLRVTGNLMTILVVTKYKDMRTTTNLYLSSMAFSDLLIFLCMPLDLYRIWRAKVVVTKGRVRGVILVLWISHRAKALEEKEGDDWRKRFESR
ncbi:growth hormone secretagogue receptor a isoform X5 [Danio rerio]|uniref:Growth hormone secretagogue receptor a isoform X5 n=1 Tax=Danio rerio TaxID=7955 RepID=A0AC58H6D1_DANRE